MLNLRIEIGDGEPERAQFLQERITVGRSVSCDLPLLDLSLSRQHAIIERVDGRWLIADSGSRNGTFVNGLALEEPRVLSPGDVLKFGSVQVTVEDGDDAPEPPSLAAAATAPANAVAEPATAEPLAPPALVLAGRRGVIRVADPRPFAYGRISVLLRGKDGDNRDVCVKLFHGVRRETWHQADAFEREVAAQGTLEHPNILPILDYGLESPGQRNPFIVMPFCEGGDLRQVLQQRAFWPLASVLPVLSQIAQALDVAHGAGFIHGDVKPENILFRKDRAFCYLSDFGLSRYFGFQEEVTTQVGGGGGTTVYLSPEQVKAEQSSPLSDVYAFATLCYELLTGRRPFDTEGSPVAQMMAKAFKEPADPQLYNPGLSDGCRNALLHGLQNEPGRRPRSAGEFLAELAAAQSPASTSRTGPRRGPAHTAAPAPSRVGHPRPPVAITLPTNRNGLQSVGEPRAEGGLLDVVLVHGLGGDSWTTWMANPDDAATFWPGWLMQDFPEVAVWTLGYAASVSKWREESMPLADRGNQVLELLASHGLGRRAIVFVTHSMGGIVVKQLLRHAESFGVPRWSDIAARTRGIAFIATPHSGARIAAFAQLAAAVLRTNEQVGELAEHDSRLRELHGWFLRFQRDRGLSCRTYCERRELRAEIPLLGIKLPKGLLVVDETSAEPDIPGERAVPLDEDHLSICKPTSRDADLYLSLRAFLRECVAAVSPPET